MQRPTTSEATASKIIDLAARRAERALADQRREAERDPLASLQQTADAIVGKSCEPEARIRARLAAADPFAQIAADALGLIADLRTSRERLLLAMGDQ